ncbi:MAG: hypothetical protein LC620_00405, partial [Halobacteriales archaeon]|nr:hypothetical protein [Halobacteriales archaeon]
PLTLTLTASAGCSASSATNVATAAGAAAGAETSSYWTITMTAQECRGHVEGKVVSGGVTIYDAFLSFNVHAQDYTNTLAGTVSVAQSGNWQIDNRNRLCDASAFAAACNIPRQYSQTYLCGGLSNNFRPLLDYDDCYEVVQGGSIGLHSDGVIQVWNDNRECGPALSSGAYAQADCFPPIHYVCNLDGTDAGFAQSSAPYSVLNPSTIGRGLHNCVVPDTVTVTPCSTQALAADPNACTVNMKLCDAANPMAGDGTTCATPEVRVLQGDPWKMDNRDHLCQGGEWGEDCAAFSELDVLARGCGASAHAAECIVPTVNVAQSGEWTVTDHNDGTLSITNSGGQTLTVHQDPMCTATQHCFVDSAATNTFVGNSTQNVNFPSNLTMTPLAVKTSFDPWLPILGATIAWIAVAVGTRFIRKDPLRLVADLAGYSVLLLPLPQVPFLVLAAAETALLIYDLVALVTGKQTT